MLTKRQNKRKTRQVRIESELHKKVKFLAIEKGTTISKLLDEICINYFGKKQ